SSSNRLRGCLGAGHAAVEPRADGARAHLRKLSTCEKRTSAFAFCKLIDLESPVPPVVEAVGCIGLEDDSRASKEDGRQGSFRFTAERANVRSRNASVGFVGGARGRPPGSPSRPEQRTRNGRGNARTHPRRELCPM